MLTYVSTGIRDFGRQPVVPQVRRSWEFYVALRGEISPLLDSSHAPVDLESNCLWLFPPVFPHGWQGDPAKKARIAVFHYTEIPADLDTLVWEAPVGYLKVSLLPAECDSLYRLAKDLISRKGEGSNLFPYYAERALIDLSLLLLKKCTRQLPGHADMDSDDFRIEVAEDYFRAHLTERPSINVLSHVTGVSESHLRYLFQRKYGYSTREALIQIQIQRALELLVCTNSKIEVIAESCGFSDASSFCRGFRRVIGKTPLEYRKSMKSKAAACLSDRPERAHPLPGQSTTPVDKPDGPTNGVIKKVSVDSADGQTGLAA